jgi:hypothetical protein
MKTNVVSSRSRSIKAVLEQARDEDIFVRAEDRSRFLIQAVDDFQSEIDGQRRNQKLMKFLDQTATQKRDWIPLRESGKSVLV